ncbi:hypothetical protein M0R04_03630 [Candidatus Dojkabacteria bacterium]|jgi:hypothetical protein|nr:hypothetical protein [Candidatus Dojkabacteria bacterium]
MANPSESTIGTMLNASQKFGQIMNQEEKEFDKASNMYGTTKPGTVAQRHAKNQINEHAATFGTAQALRGVVDSGIKGYQEEDKAIQKQTDVNNRFNSNTQTAATWGKTSDKMTDS